MNRYDLRFIQLHEHGQKAFIPFTLLGWPDRETCLEIVKMMIQSGAAALELGLAFSDPVADGPIIQQAAFETLASGFRVRDAFDLLREIRCLDQDIPIGLLVYYNMVLAKGVEQFFQQAAEAGVDGVLIADLPPEAEPEVFTLAKKNGMAPICIISPLTSKERLPLIGQQAGGFLYVVSRLGITGTEERYDTQLQALLERARAQTKLPLCVGFGISTPEQAHKMFAAGADGVITGSKILQLVQENQGKALEQTLKPFLEAMNRMAQTGMPEECQS